MPLKTLLVCLTDAETAEALTRVAVHLARRCDAHLIGLHVMEALMVYPGVAMHLPGPAYATFDDSQKAEAARIEAAFTRATGAELVSTEFRLLRSEAALAGDWMVDSARAADLVMIAQSARDAERDGLHDAQIRLIRESGRPVLVIPPDHDGGDIGANIVLGWSDTREASRAAHDMLMLARDEARVTVLRVGREFEDGLTDTGGIGLCEALARHGCKATLEHRAPAGHAIAEVLGQTAFEQGADLMVTGAFGHSRAYDFVLGATSYALLKDARLPVLFSK